MARMNVTGILNGMEMALKAVNEMMPVAQALGVPAVVANVSTIAIAAIAVGHNVLDRAQGVKDALAEQDEAKLRAMIGELQGVNDKLAGQIADDAEETAGGGSEGAGAQGGSAPGTQ